MVVSGMLTALRPGDHICCTFADEANRWATVRDQVDQGVRDGHKVIYFARPDETVTARLAEIGVLTRIASAGGQLEVIPAAQTYLADDAFNPARMLGTLVETVEATRRAGWPGLRIVADMTWATHPDCDERDLVWYEAQANRVFADGYASAVCMHDSRVFPPDVLAEIISAHEGTTSVNGSHLNGPMLRMRRTSLPPGLRLSGEIDLSNHRAFATVLASLIDDLGGPSGPVTIDVTELTFADAAAAHLLLRMTTGDQARMRLVGASPLLRRALDLLDLPGASGGVAAG